MSGIFRDVYILARPQSHIRDYFVKDRLSATTSPQCHRQCGAEARRRLHGEPACSLLPTGRRLARGHLQLGRTWRLSWTLPCCGTRNSPYLYTLILSHRRRGDPVRRWACGRSEVRRRRGLPQRRGRSSSGASTVTTAIPSPALPSSKEQALTGPGADEAATTSTPSAPATTPTLPGLTQLCSRVRLLCGRRGRRGKPRRDHLQLGRASYSAGTTITDACRRSPV